MGLKRLAWAGPIALLMVLGDLTTAHANGEHIHFGALVVEVPPLVAWIGGGVFAFFILMFVSQWVLYNLSRRKSGVSPETNYPQRQKREDNDGS